MDIQAQITMLERRGEWEAAELLRQASPAPVSAPDFLPVGEVLSYQKAAEAVRDSYCKESA